MATTVGEIVVIAKMDTSQYKAGAKQVDAENKKMESSTSKSTSGMRSSLNAVGKAGLMALAAVAAAATAIIVKNIDGAVSRVDTLVAFPRMMKAMGASTKDANASIQKIAKSLEGLPTSLDQGARGVQQLVSTGIKLPKATEAFLAFNNAMLAGNTNADTAAATFIQLQQALSRGRIEAQEWNSIAGTMPTAMQALQKETGLTKEGLRQLYATNPQKLLDDLIRLNKEGGGGMASLDEQARIASKGIRTSFENMDLAVQKGMVSIIEKIGDGDLATGQQRIGEVGKTIGEAMKTAMEWVSSLDWQPVIDGATLFFGAIKWLFDEIGKNKEAMDGLKTVVLGIGAALVIVVGAFVLFVAGLVGAAILIGVVINKIGKWFADMAWNVSKAILDMYMWVVKTWNNIKTTTTNVFNAIGAFFRGLWNGIVGFVTSTINRIKNFFVNGWNSIVSTTRSIWNGIVSTISGVVGRVIGVVSGLPGRIKGFFSKAGSWLVNAGKSIIDGLKKGIESVANAPKKALEAVMGGLKRLLPSSPAKEGPFSGKGWTLYSGMSIVDALAAGITKEAAVAQGAMNSLMTGMAGTIATPTISPLGVSSLTGDNISGGGSGSSASFYGDIHIASEVDADRFLTRAGLSREQSLSERGMTV